MIGGAPIAAVPIASVPTSGEVIVLPPDHGEPPVAIGASGDLLLPLFGVHATMMTAKKRRMLDALQSIATLARSKVPAL